MLVPVILSGGIGARLWPVSREACPKPFMRLNGSQSSLLQKTYERAIQLPNIKQIITTTNIDYYHQSKQELAKLDHFETFTSIDFRFLLEPMSCNTAPALGITALFLEKWLGKQTVMLILPADHLILNQKKFNVCVHSAYQLAKAGYLTTFGVIPNKAETAYGYIEYQEDLILQAGHAIKNFHEKPSLEQTQLFIEQGNYLWNCGIFCFTVETLLNEFATYAPALHQQLLSCAKHLESSFLNKKSDQVKIDAGTFSTLEKISIDYAVMEKTKNSVVIPADFGWSDLGSWDSFNQLLTPDQYGNRIVGDVILQQSSQTTVYNENGSGRIIAGLGLNNLTIVDTKDALLISDNQHIQQVKQLVERLKHSGRESYRYHPTVYRPWGYYTVLEEGSKYKLKRIIVHPQASLSLQLHHHRSEYWIMIEGTAQVQRNDEILILNPQESIMIPLQSKHCIENIGHKDLMFIELQYGEYLGEDDIVRFEDNYGRVIASQVASDRL